MKLTPPVALIFDWDNTLVNTWPVIHDALNATFSAMGHEPWTLEMTQERVRKSMRDSFPEIFGADWKKAGEMYQKHYKSSHLNKIEGLPGAQEMLKTLQALNLPAVVVSNKKGPTLRLEVEKLGWRDYFVSLVGSDDAARDKPHPDPVHMALEELEMTPGPDIWFVGDSEIDLECAEATGCTSVLYGHLAKDHPDYTPTHYQGFSYHHHVMDHAALIALLPRPSAAKAKK